ncbi:hypothetical protein [Ekhidna sp. To15]|uniref:hypothetical protein n=1 Tax=Ekhidna sp. To15 TaxID=3395267 RepID=UPI003F5224C3
MKFTTLTIYLAVFALIVNTSFSQTQSDSTKYQITTTSGSVFVGMIIDENEKEVKIDVQDIGVITIPRAEIKEMIALETPPSAQSDQLWPYQYQTSNYFASLSAYSLKKKEGYYQNVWILFNNVSYGLTDNLSMGIGTMATFFFTDWAPFWLTGKYTVPIVENKFNAGIGGVFGAVEDSSFGFLYGLATFGTRDRNITIGAGSAFGEGENSDILFTISGTFRTGPKFYLILDSYHIQQDVSFTFIGGRSIIGRASLEYGLLTSRDFNFLGIPLLGVTLPLHKK